MRTFFSRHKEILLLLLLTLVFYQKIILHPTQMLFPSGDIFGIYYAEKLHFVSEILQNKALPLWNPYSFGGFPFLADPVSALLYPFNLLYFFFPIASAFGFLFALDTFLIGVFTYFFAKKIIQNSLGALTAAVILMFSGSLMNLVYLGHLMNLDTFLWFPLILLGAEYIIFERKLRYSFYTAIPIGLSFLAGATQVAAFSFLAASIYFFLRAVFETSKRKDAKLFIHLLILYSISVIFGLSLAAIQLFPSQEFYELSIRNKGVSFDFATDFLLHPYQTIAFILPNFFGGAFDFTYFGKGNYFSSSAYLGILPLLLAFIAIVKNRNIYVYIFLSLLIFSLLYSFGKYTPVFSFFYHYIPGFNSFRVPARFLYTYTFSLSILAGFGMSFIQQHAKNDFFRKNTVILSIISLLLLGILILFQNTQFLQNIYINFVLKNKYASNINTKLLSYLTQDIQLLFFVLLFACILFFAKLRWNLKTIYFSYALILLLYCNLFYFGTPFIQTISTSYITDQPKILEKISLDKELFRVFNLKGVLLPVMINHELQNVTGIGSMQLKSYQEFLWLLGKHKNTPYESFFDFENISNPTILNLLNVKYVVSEKQITNTEFLKVTEGEIEQKQIPGLASNPHHTYFVYRNINVLPRVYLVPNSITLSKEQTLSAIEKKTYNFHNTVILEKKIQLGKQNEKTFFSQTKITTYQPNKIELEATTSSPQFLVLSETWYPGWKAFDNGKQTEIFQANYIQKAVHIPSGKHKILFTYDPYSYKIGKLLSIITLIILSAYILLQRKKDVLKKIHRVKQRLLQIHRRLRLG